MLLYTLHAKQRMHLRVISEAEVRNALEFGTITEVQEDGNIVICHDRVRIVFALSEARDQITIITVIHAKTFQKEVNRLAKQSNISARQAAKQLKGVA